MEKSVEQKPNESSQDWLKGENTWEFLMSLWREIYYSLVWKSFIMPLKKLVNTINKNPKHIS